MILTYGPAAYPHNAECVQTFSVPRRMCGVFKKCPRTNRKNSNDLRLKNNFFFTT